MCFIDMSDAVFNGIKCALHKHSVNRHPEAVSASVMKWNQRAFAPEKAHELQTLKLQPRENRPLLFCGRLAVPVAGAHGLDLRHLSLRLGGFFAFGQTVLQGRGAAVFLEALDGLCGLFGAV